MDVSVEQRKTMEGIIENITTQIKEKDNMVRNSVQNDHWDANCADDQAEIVCMKRKVSKLRLYLEMVELNPVESSEYKLGMKKINKEIIIHNHKAKHWK